MRAAWKSIVLLLLPVLLPADALEDAAHLLASKIASHLTVQERVGHIVIHNLSAISTSDGNRVRTTIEAALRKSPQHRVSIEVVVTLSENAAGYLLVAEVHKPGGEAVEMQPLMLTTIQPATMTQPALSKRLLWQQPDPVLDLVQIENHMLVLQPQSLAIFEAQNKQWLPIEQASLNVARVRDPRARLEVQGHDVSAYFPGATCRGTWQPLRLICEARNSDFTLANATVHFVPARNTLEGLPPTQFDDEVPVCGSLRLAASANARTEADNLAIFNGVTAISELVPVPGPVTALWPTADGALAVVHNFSSNQYTAYALTVDCGQ
jgi:hypothetical protein